MGMTYLHLHLHLPRMLHILLLLLGTLLLIGGKHAILLLHLHVLLLLLLPRHALHPCMLTNMWSHSIQIIMAAQRSVNQSFSSMALTAGQHILRCTSFTQLTCQQCSS